MPDTPFKVTVLSELMSPKALRLLSASGTDLVKQIGMDVVRGIVLDVLTGKNLRDSTEVLTRRRIAALNLAMIRLFMQGAALSNDFTAQLPHLATQLLTTGHLSKTDRWLAQWVLGLTDKAYQNVLRDNPEALAAYRDQYIEACRNVIASNASDYGEIRGLLALDSGVKAEVNWLFLTYLLNTVGAQTLAIRGSEKSAYGKLFERLILGSLLHILEFEHVVPPPPRFERVFWLSSQGEKRESDATLLYEPGKGVRFDIGFIGRGNPEISLDKVTRFEREIEMGRSGFYMATIILIDRIGRNSGIEGLAKRVDGTIIQMSASYWPQQVARILNQTCGLKHALVDMPQEHIGDFLRDKLAQVPLEDFIGLSETWKHNVIKENLPLYDVSSDLDQQEED
jgi:hypothetical protein